MRRAHEPLRERIADNVGLAYDVLAPIASDGNGKIPEDRRGDWLEKLEHAAVSEDYARAYARWKASFGEGARLLEVELASRLLVGHGNSAPTEVGLTLHRTWGVPVIPGSALKGLLSHYVDAVLGPDLPGLHPEDPSLDSEQRERAAFQGVTWRDRRPLYGPGRYHAALFGAPDVAVAGNLPGTPAHRGEVAFEDALYVPGSAKDDKPFAADVITVHQKPYYDRKGVGHGPTDHYGPNPVAFLTVRPGARFLLALSGPSDWTHVAMALLQEALVGWGVGAKTSLGYGRIVATAIGNASAAGGSHAGEARRWVDRTIAEIAGSLRVPERVVLRGRQLAERWAEMEEGALRLAVRDEIFVRLEPEGLLKPDARPSKNERRALAIYRETED